MHDLVHHLLLPLLQLADPTAPANPTVPSPPSQDNTFKVAIVTTLGIVIATTVTAAASFFRRDTSARSTVVASDNFTKQFVTGLEKDRRELHEVRDAYALLREACIDRGMSPDHLIMDQERIRGERAEEDEEI